MTRTTEGRIYLFFSFLSLLAAHHYQRAIEEHELLRNPVGIGTYYFILCLSISIGIIFLLLFLEIALKDTFFQKDGARFTKSFVTLLDFIYVLSGLYFIINSFRLSAEEFFVASTPHWTKLVYQLPAIVAFSFRATKAILDVKSLDWPKCDSKNLHTRGDSSPPPIAPRLPSAAQNEEASAAVPVNSRSDTKQYSCIPDQVRAGLVLMDLRSKYYPHRPSYQIIFEAGSKIRVQFSSEMTQKQIANIKIQWP
mgnify:CR=1 FL=1